MDIVAIEVPPHGYFFATIHCTLNQLGLLYIPVENHTKFQLKTIPLINAYLLSFFTNERRVKNDKYEYKAENYSSSVPGWLF